LTFTGPLRHTGPLQTFADLATIESRKLLEYRVESGLRLGLVAESELWALASRYGLRDQGRLEFVLRQRGRGTPPTGSYLETVAVRVVRTCRVTPTAVRQYPIVIDGRIVFYLDLAWPEIRLYGEVDGRAFHDIDDASYHHDRRRQRQLTALGWQRVPLTARDLLRYPKATADDLDRCYVTRASELGVAV
jgi:very-short-patch-repair endonuclease